jgi:lysozyme
MDTEMMAICYGHRSFKGDKKTKEECWAMMMTSAEIMIKYIGEIYTRELKENQIVALASLHYNVKNPSDTVWRANNGYSDESIANSIRQYTYAGGVQLRGLVNRRNAEANLFLTK